MIAYSRMLPIRYTVTFEISFSGSSDTNHESIIKNITTFEIYFSGSSETKYDGLL